MAVCACLELSRHVRRITPFTHEIFAVFVCSIYVVDGVRGVLGRFGGRPAQFGEALFATNLSLLTFGASAWLSSALRWRVLSVGLRTFLADYAVTFAVVATTVRAAALHAEGYNPACWRLRPGTVEAAALRISSPVRYQVASFCVSGVAVERISLPSHLSPTCFLAGGGECISDAHSRFRQHARPWRVSVEDAPVRLWLVALASAVPITFFFYMDQVRLSLGDPLTPLTPSPSHPHHSGAYLLHGAEHLESTLPAAQARPQARPLLPLLLPVDGRLQRRGAALRPALRDGQPTALAAVRAGAHAHDQA